MLRLQCYLTPSLAQPVKFPGSMMHGCAYKQYIFRSYTFIFNSMHFDENSFTCQCEKDDKKAEGFQTSHFYGLFSKDIMAVKELKIKMVAM